MSQRESDNVAMKKHIFAVNGDPDFLELVRELLQDRRYNVTTTNFVPRTLDQIKALAPDLVLIDLAIGEQAGWDLLEDLQAEIVTAEIPVVVTSTDPRFLEIASRNQRRYGEHTYISKPMDVSELRRTIETLVGDA